MRFLFTRPTGIGKTRGPEMTITQICLMLVRWQGALAVALFMVAAPAAAANDPNLVTGPTKCAECHKKEAAVWKQTHHFLTFETLPHSKDARKIAEKMGVRRLKADSLCLGCHFTVQTVDGSPKAIAGISCESCHFAGKNWIKVHSGFSGKKEGQETKAEIAERWKKSEEAGMIRPKMTYRLAKNCFSCHLVPQEKLVNVGGHAAGSDFELVSWSQGEVRHNLWYNKGVTNRDDSIERKRMLFIVGRVVESEMTLRGVAKATQKANYAFKMAKRADNARKVMAILAKLLPDAPELKQIAEIGAAAQLKLNNEAELTAAADKISVLGLKFSDGYDGTKFGAIDKYIPGPDKYKGKVVQ